MPTKEQRQWYENTVLITIAGSIIVVVGQLAGTIIPLMYGPADISDYSISVNPAFIRINQSELSQRDSIYNWINAEVKIEDFHPYLRPYRYLVYLNVLEKPKGVDTTFSPNNEGKPGDTIFLTILIDKSKEIFYSPIKIQGIGENGKIRNVTIYLSAIR